MKKEIKDENITIIDGTDLILGRLASEISKKLLLGENIKIVNCKDIVILGRKNYLFEKYKNKLTNKVIKQGPYYSRSPADIVKRAFRNMLPYKNKRGAEAFKRLKCYNSTPSTLINAQKANFDNVKINNDSVFYYTKVGDISQKLGYNKSK
ncbi:MAG: 50S ribosomal protein L13 [Nanoarchaeota archaeon]